MDSRHNGRSLLPALAAAAFSGAAFYLSVGLEPRWWAALLAALPVLWIAPRLPWAAAAGVALAARAIGALSMWEYYGRLQFPMWLRLASVIVPAVGFCAAVMLSHVFFRRGRPWLAVFAFPAVSVAFEYLISLGSGTFGATAYTQLANLPVLQFGALTGLWGISFVVMLFPSMLAAMSLSPARIRGRLAIAFAVIFGYVLTHGVVRLATAPPAPHEIAVGLAVSDLPGNTLPQNDQDALRLLREYTEQVRLLARRGARIVLLPEMTALVRDSISGQVDALYRETARSANVKILLGVLHASSNGTFNEARLYSESGALDAVYRKHHLVPVLEGRTTPGDDISVIAEPFGTVGLEICRDMDYPDPARRYGKARAGLVLVPAWDFDVDRFWHGHLAILRGVENGFTVVRAAKQGLLYVSDNRGRILSEKRTTPAEPFTTMLATVPVRHDKTLYQSWGDWFAWVDLAALAGLLVALVITRSRARASEINAPAQAGAVVAEPNQTTR